MNQSENTQNAAPSRPPVAARRMVVYAARADLADPPRYVDRALDALRPIADRLVVVGAGRHGVPASERVRAQADDVVIVDQVFSRQLYRVASDRPGNGFEDFDEVILTGDDGYVRAASGIEDVLSAMAERDVDAWELVENRDGAPREFVDQGFPARVSPHLWLAVRGAAYRSASWSSDRLDVAVSASLRAEGLRVASYYGADAFGNGDPAVFSPERLLAAGCPILSRASFTLYPPLLQQFAVIGRQTLGTARALGFDVDEILSDLAATVPPKALNANAGMVEVLTPGQDESRRRRRIIALAHIADLAGADELLGRLDHLPPGYDLIVTTSDGVKASRLEAMLQNRERPGFASSQVRVTPASAGRDMSDFFIGCRDVLLSDDYDLVVKVHARPMRRKTEVVRRYFRRYQLDNLLGSAAHVRRILALFDREAGLGLVFPPMIHIGHQTMGRGWSGLRPHGEQLARELGIEVPLDRVSPLAPFGGMFIARPSALRLVSERKWTYRDYDSPRGRRFTDLARLQQRVLAAAAGQRGYHVRTVLNPEHAEISHTALEFKVDQMFSTTTGYPVDQITLIQRAGWTGHGGVVGLGRMYLRLNHPRAARMVLPLTYAAERVYRAAATPAGALRQRLSRRQRREETT